jgi:hydrogenase maturation protein HypF
VYCQIIINGVVQGIGFRPFVYNLAIKHELTGFVLNRGDAGVEIQISGSESQIRQFIQDLKDKKPSLAKYERFTPFFSPNGITETKFDSFEISKSSLSRGKEGSYIPPDLPICDKCVEEMNYDPRRLNYSFTSCVDCGPRYSVITSLPYDRPRTVMDKFPLCPECTVEYTNPTDRRFHAQTTCCWYCGPRYYLLDNKGNKILSSQDFQDNWHLPAQLLNEGKILAIKGIGGTHIACRTMKDDSILKIRKWKGARGDKPFAIMSLNREAVQRYAYCSDFEESILQSIVRPIVLLNKKESFPLSKYVSPSLHNIGVLFPYAGIHYSLLKEISDPAIVMTSGNPTNIPIFIDNSIIQKNLSSIVDYFLLHDREIYQRIDDSVLRVHSLSKGSYPLIIRRSRGYVPEPIQLPWKGRIPTVIALGAEMHSVGSIGIGKRVFPTQHIGHLSTIENIDFLKDSLAHMKNLLGIKNVEGFGGDLHPQFSSTILGKEFALEYDVPFYQFQHHHAHLSALAIDGNVDPDEEIICAALDGTGYGADGAIWGGEILMGNFSGYKRLAHLENLLIPGGDMAIKRPYLALLSVLLSFLSAEEISVNLNKIPWLKWIFELPDYQLVLKSIEKQMKNSEGFKHHQTSSCGRVLDIISVLLGATRHRTYEGEPAIKLESFALNKTSKKRKLDLSLPSHKTVQGQIEIKTKEFISGIWECILENQNRHMLALTAEKMLARKIADVAIQLAIDHGINKIGASGGVCYNKTIFSEFSKQVLNEESCELITHKKIPCGDGGISIGQIPLIQAKLF